MVMNSPGNHTSKNIGEPRYEKLLFAKKAITLVLLIEEAFDIVIDNYLEFENALLQTSSNNLVRFSFSIEQFTSARSLLNRLFINLLSVGSAYLGQVTIFLDSYWVDDKSKQTKIKKCICQNYDNHLGYRVLCALRNHVQHFGWPIHSVQYNIKLVGKNNDQRFLHTTVPYLKTQYLTENKGFKRNILLELEKIEEINGIDIRPLIREYIEALSDIHTSLRAAILLDMQLAENVIQKALSQLRRRNDSLQREGFDLLRVQDEQVADRVYISLQPFNLKNALENKNLQLKNLPLSYVTNEVLIQS